MWCQVWWGWSASVREGGRGERRVLPQHITFAEPLCLYLDSPCWLPGWRQILELTELQPKQQAASSQSSPPLCLSVCQSARLPTTLLFVRVSLLLSFCLSLSSSLGLSVLFSLALLVSLSCPPPSLCLSFTARAVAPAGQPLTAAASDREIKVDCWKQLAIDFLLKNG